MATEDKKKVYQVEVIAGPSTGKRVKSSSTQISIGTARTNTLRISGRLISELHATIEPGQDGGWIVRNHSPQGTLLNKRKVDRAPIEPGDHLQIGGETLVRFSEVKGFDLGGLFKTKSPARPLESRKSGRNVAIAGGIFLYLAVAGYFLLGDTDTKPVSAELNAGSQKQLVALSKKCLLGSADARGPDMTASASSPNHVRTEGDERALYDLVQVHLQHKDAKDAESAADELLANVDNHLFKAWAARSQGSYAVASEEYAKITRLLPNYLCPVARYAIQQQREMNAMNRPKQR